MKRSKKAFSLVELIVVIAIIGILSALGYSGFKIAKRSARNAARSSVVKQEIYSFLQDYESKCKGRPNSISFNTNCTQVTFSAGGSCSQQQTYDITPISGITSCQTTTSCSPLNISSTQLVVLYNNSQGRLGVYLEGSNSPEMVEGTCAGTQ